jgi:hypothetical protein
MVGAALPLGLFTFHAVFETFEAGAYPVLQAAEESYGVGNEGVIDL